jgi:hypothetical protein
MYLVTTTNFSLSPNRTITPLLSFSPSLLLFSPSLHPLTVHNRICWESRLSYTVDITGEWSSVVKISTTIADFLLLNLLRDKRHYRYLVDLRELRVRRGLR